MQDATIPAVKSAPQWRAGPDAILALAMGPREGEALQGQLPDLSAEMKATEQSLLAQRQRGALGMRS